MNQIKKILSFSAVGTLTTLLSLIMSVGLLKYAKTPLIPTYIFVYSTTLVISYLLNSKLTFNATISAKKGGIYLAVYLFTMGVGTFLYAIVPTILILENWYYPFVILPFTASLNYLLSNRYLKPDRQ